MSSNEEEPTITAGQKRYFKRVIKDLTQEFNLKMGEIRSFQKELIEGGDGKLPLKQKIEKIASDAELNERKMQEHLNKSKEFYRTLIEGSEEAPSLKQRFLQVKNDLDELYEEADIRNESLSKFETQMLGDEEKGIDGLRQKLNSMETKLSSDMETWNKKYSDLHDQIEGLLPGATTVGLATSYHNQKSSYRIPTWIWSAVFFFTIVVMCMYGINLLQGANVPKTLSEAIIALMTRLPFFGPLIWLAWFASKQQSQNKRLEEEYAFKETLAKSFDGFKKQIDELENDTDKESLRSKLMDAIVEISRNNPSSTLDNKSHGEQPSFINSIMNRVVGKGGTNKD